MASWLWLILAFFAALVSFFAKIGLSGINSLYPHDCCLAIVLNRKEYKGVKAISKKSWFFLTLSGIATGGACLCEYYSLSVPGKNAVAINAIGKLSILLTMAISFFFVKEKFSKNPCLDWDY